MKVATIGTSFITEWFIKATKLNDGVECVAIHSRNLEKGNAFAKKNGINKVYCDLDEMLANPSIDTIYVASPNSLHFDYSLKAIQAGKNVICEKPFTTTVKELDYLIAAAKKYNVFLFEAIVTLHSPNYQMIKENVSRLGTIRCVQCNFSQYSSRYNNLLAGETPNVFNPSFSGGALADINIYNLHFTIGLFGTPKEVHYFPNKHQNGIDTSGVVILEYDGFKAICVGAKDTKSKCLTQIQGEKGYISMESETSRCSTFTLTIDGTTKSPAIEENPISLFYEVQDFVKIYNKRDYQTCYELLAYSRSVMEVYEKARKDGGIVFDADK
ncbi:MAG: Gfo/Idh/MocA family oxidoreductase [Erysipelotrichaceae bacterium]